MLRKYNSLFKEKKINREKLCKHDIEINNFVEFNIFEEERIL